MKYKRLTDKELEVLKDKFVDFLVLNGITADDWVKLKDSDRQNASKMIDSFSDVMYEGWLRSIDYLEIVLPKEVMCFYCQPDQIVLVGLSTDTDGIDFTTMTDFSRVRDLGNTIDVYTKTKGYTKPRELEIFGMMENGAKSSNKELFNVLCLAL